MYTTLAHIRSTRRESPARVSRRRDNLDGKEPAARRQVIEAD